MGFGANLVGLGICMCDDMEQIHLPGKQKKKNAVDWSLNENIPYPCSYRLILLRFPELVLD
jgi:hypothetical protein